MAVALPAIRRIAIQRSLDDAEFVLAKAACELIAGSRVYVHYVRPDTRTLWTIDVPDLGVPVGGVSVIAFAAQVGQMIGLERIAAHPLYAPEVDDPIGSGDEAALLAPIVCDGVVLGIVTVVREPWCPSFGAADRVTLAALCAKAAPLIAQFLPG